MLINLYQQNIHREKSTEFTENTTIKLFVESTEKHQFLFHLFTKMSVGTPKLNYNFTDHSM